MKPLETNQRILTWLCGCPPNEFDGKWQKIAYKFFTFNIIATLSLAVIAGAIFIHRNLSIDLEGTLFSLFHTLAAISMIYQCIVTVMLCDELNNIFQGLSIIYDASKLTWTFSTEKHSVFSQSVKNNVKQVFVPKYLRNLHFNTDQNSESFTILTDTNQKCEFISNLYIKYFMSSVFVTNFMGAVVSVILCFIINGHIEVTFLYHIYKYV